MLCFYNFLILHLSHTNIITMNYLETTYYFIYIFFYGIPLTDKQFVLFRDSSWPDVNSLLFPTYEEQLKRRTTFESLRKFSGIFLLHKTVKIN